MNQLWPSWATVGVCLLCAMVQLYWGGQDKAGRFHAVWLWADGNAGMSLFYLGPYLLFVVSALVGWRRRAARNLMLVGTLCAVSLLTGWIDHDQYLRTPPGRETPRMLNFIATAGLWLASTILLIANATSRLAGTRASSPP